MISVDPGPWTVSVVDPSFLAEGMRFTTTREGEQVTVLLGRQISLHTFEVAAQIVKRSWTERLFSWPWKPWKSERIVWFDVECYGYDE